MSTDEPDAEDLAEAFPHVAQLEEDLKEADIDVGDIPQRKGTTRRDLLAGSAGLLGLGGLFTAGSGTAAAGDDQVGSLGTDGNRLDAEIEDLDLTDQSSTPTGPGSGQVRFYAKNGSLYYKPAGGSETEVGSGGGGSGAFTDGDGDGTYTLPNTSDGISVQDVSAQSVNTGNTTTASAPLIDVTHPDYGAVGDGSTDDSAAIASAISDANSNGGTVLLPQGNTFALGSQLSLQGVSDVGLWIPQGATLTQTDSAGLQSLFRVDDTSDFAAFGEGEIDANAANQSRTDVYVARAPDSNGRIEDVTFADLTITGTKEVAFQLIPKFGPGNATIYFEGLTFDGHDGNSADNGNLTRSCIHMDGDFRDAVVENCDFIQPVGNASAVSAEAADNVTVRENYVELVTESGRTFILDGANCSARENTVLAVEEPVDVGDVIRIGGDGSNGRAVGNTIILGDDSDRGIVLGTLSQSETRRGMMAIDNTVIGAGNMGIEITGDSSAGNYTEDSLIALNTVVNSNQNENASSAADAGAILLRAARDVSCVFNSLGDTQATATQEYPVWVFNDCSDVSVGDNHTWGHATTEQVQDNGTRTRLGGQVELGGAPSASNYGPDDAGLRLLDTSTSPESVYYVLSDGSLTGAT